MSNFTHIKLGTINHRKVELLNPSKTTFADSLALVCFTSCVSLYFPAWDPIFVPTSVTMCLFWHVFWHIFWHFNVCSNMLFQDIHPESVLACVLASISKLDKIFSCKINLKLFKPELICKINTNITSSKLICQYATQFGI